MADQKKPVDWEAVERDFRAGILSLRQMAEEHGVNHVAITRHAKKEGWTRDLTAKINARAMALVTAEAVTVDVTAKSSVSEREIIEVNAEMQAGIVRSHRKDIQRSRSLAMRMLEELEQTTDNNDLFRELGELLHAPDEKGNDRRNELYRKVIDMPMRIDGVKKLAETLKVLVGLERQAFGLKDGDDDTNKSSYEDLLRSVLNG